jgi:hypothetical protein
LTVECQLIGYEGAGLSVENVEVLPLSLLDLLGWLAGKHLGLSLCARADMDVGMDVVDSNGINRRQLTRIIKISIITVLVTQQDSRWSR